MPAPPDVAAPPSDAEKSSSGLASKVLTAGTGTTHPRASDSVTVHYTGWTTDGTMFDSSVSRGVPSTFPRNGVIRGWTEGLQLMVVGEKRRFWIPENLAYPREHPGSGSSRPRHRFDLDAGRDGDCRASSAGLHEHLAGGGCVPCGVGAFEFYCPFLPDHLRSCW